MGIDLVSEHAISMKLPSSCDVTNNISVSYMHSC